jgi:hypothetical protein
MVAAGFPSRAAPTIASPLRKKLRSSSKSPPRFPLEFLLPHAPASLSAGRRRRGAPTCRLLWVVGNWVVPGGSRNHESPPSSPKRAPLWQRLEVAVISPVYFAMDEAAASCPFILQATATMILFVCKRPWSGPALLNPRLVVEGPPGDAACCRQSSTIRELPLK